MRGFGPAVTQADVEFPRPESERPEQLVAQLSLQAHLLRQAPFPTSTEGAVPGDDG
jgi:hypothetical protein